MRRFWIALPAFVLSIAGGVGVVSAFSTGAPTPTTREAADTAAANQPRLGAVTQAVHGDERVGVVAYRNKSGRRCFGAGTVRNGTVGAVDRTGKFSALPLAEGGTCKVDSASVGVELRPDDKGGTSIFGLADPDVTKISIDLGDETVTTEPQDDGTFAITTNATVSGRIVITATHEDGEDEHNVISAPPALPSLEEMRAAAPKAP